jgi:DNA-binding transcriptional regulator PaaX
MKFVYLYSYVEDKSVGRMLKLQSAIFERFWDEKWHILHAQVKRNLENVPSSTEGQLVLLSFSIKF